MGMIESLPAARNGALDAIDRSLFAALQDGLPLVSRPHQAIADRLGLTEDEVLRRLRRLLAAGVVKRMGLIVRHHELGYGANAMVVWDVPDEQVGDVGRRLAAFKFVTLCYRRARSLPRWRYNLYCMIHGRDRETVERRIEALSRVAEMHGYPRTTLFSRRRFKQCGARYVTASSAR
ncbi:MAG TPA: AsnC family transcriptional regulator [Burkholderiales bacterium]|nr:AsnC family transcriptional regulator [Burkholderiales bacterium]